MQIGLATQPAESDVIDMWFRRPFPFPLNRQARARGCRRHGFTLIEAALAIVIVGVGVVAAVQLLAVGSKSNADAHRLTTGLNLAANIRELVQERSTDQVLALHNQSYSPPRDARNQPIDGLPEWQQAISAVRVDPDEITSDAAGSNSRLIRLGVAVSYRGNLVTHEEWLVANTGE